MQPDTRSLFPVTAQVNDAGHLCVGGCDVVALAAEFGTPLYVYDEQTLRERCRAHLCAFISRHPDSRVLYAGKAYLGVRLAQLLCEEGLGLDVVSAGEMYVARRAGFPPQRVCLHGNNKTSDELHTALEWGIGRIVVDNLDELALLATLAAQLGVAAPILLRLAPNVDPHTHRYIATGVADSKFGLPIATGAAEAAVHGALASPHVQLLGYHAHIGSQIHELAPYVQTVQAMISFAARLQASSGYAPAEISLGGGWAVRYVPEEQVPSVDEVAAALTLELAAQCRLCGLPLPMLSVEPGRAIVAQAGVALYTAGFTKEIAGVRRYVFVDGGMADNIRPALYGARYTAVLANRVNAAAGSPVTMAGRYCESGDVLIESASLPTVAAGDTVAVAACGAYAPALASNYNMALRPVIVAVHEGQATLWRRREVLEDLVRCDA